MEALPNYDIASIATSEQGLDLILDNLRNLRAQMSVMDHLPSRADRDVLIGNIGFVKRYYERVDAIIAVIVP